MLWNANRIDVVLVLMRTVSLKENEEAKVCVFSPGTCPFSVCETLLPAPTLRKA